MVHRFEARVEPHGKTATFFHVPPDVVAALSPKKRVPVQVWPRPSIACGRAEPLAELVGTTKGKAAATAGFMRPADGFLADGRRAQAPA